MVFGSYKLLREWRGYAVVVVALSLHSATSYADPFFSSKTPSGRTVLCGTHGTTLEPGALDQAKNFVPARLAIQKLSSKIATLRLHRHLHLRSFRTRIRYEVSLNDYLSMRLHWKDLLQAGRKTCQRLVEIGANTPIPTMTIKGTTTPNSPAHLSPTATALSTVKSDTPKPQLALTGTPTPTATISRTATFTPNVTPTFTPTPSPTATPTPTPTRDPLVSSMTSISPSNVRYLYEKAALGAVPSGAYEAASSGGLPALLDFMMRYDPNELDVMTKCARFLDTEYDRDLPIAVHPLGLQMWALCNLLESRNPFHDRLTYFFFHNLLVVSATNLQYGQWVFMKEQIELFRSFTSGGSYRDLVKQHARQGATLQYLNLAYSTAAQPNEDFARELMQLYTLGEFDPLSPVGGDAARNYNESDVASLAFGITGHAFRTQYVGDIPVWTPIIVPTNVFRAPITLFGGSRCQKEFTLPPGIVEPRDPAIIDHLFDCLPVERFLAFRILREYLTEDLEPLITDGRFVQAFAAHIRANNFDIKKSLRTLFLSDEFWKPQYRDSIVITPVERFVTAARRVGYRPDPIHIRGFTDLMAQTGHQITTFPSVFGIKNMDFADASRQLQLTNVQRVMFSISDVGWKCNDVLPQGGVSVSAQAAVDHLDTMMNTNLTPQGKLELISFLNVQPSTGPSGEFVNLPNLYDSNNPTHQGRLCTVMEMMATLNYTR